MGNLVVGSEHIEICFQVEECSGRDKDTKSTTFAPVPPSASDSEPEYLQPATSKLANPEL